MRIVQNPIVAREMPVETDDASTRTGHGGGKDAAVVAWDPRKIGDLRQEGCMTSFSGDMRGAFPAGMGYSLACIGHFNDSVRQRYQRPLATRTRVLGMRFDSP